MGSLKKYIIESLLDDEDEVFDGAKENIIKDFLKTNYAIPSSYTIKETKDGFIVDVKGYIGVTNKNITSLTNGLFEFGEVDKQFYCDGCNSLKSLEGGPKKVGGSFYCDHCGSLTSLKGAPKEVGGDFNCAYCSNLKSLEGAPKEVKNFDCRRCDSLKTLKGAPKWIVGDFYCLNCKSLKTLEGSPKEVKNFDCRGCDSLVSLKGSPEKIKGHFWGDDCESLKTLEGGPKEVMGIFFATNCGKKFTEDDVKKYTKIKWEPSV